MSAELLRRAAEVVRHRALVAQHERPWCPVYTRAAVRHVERNVDLDLDCNEHPDGCGRFDMYDGEYVAMIHPPVALALAAWLDDVADSTPANADDWESVIVARAILREPS
jgi:hypothetical protein